MNYPLGRIRLCTISALIFAKKLEQITEQLEKQFLSLYNKRPSIFRSPGRVNIIGEHTDYNQGFVLPAAIDKAAYIAVSKRDDNEIHLYANQFSEHFTTSIDNIPSPRGAWSDYLLGVLVQLLERNYKPGGFDLVIEGDVPAGAGLSSSAAVECAMVCAMNHLFDLAIDKEHWALIAQKAENQYVGVQCGIMDQFASVFGKPDHVFRLDCRSLDYEYFPFNLEGYKLLLLNSNVKHSLASTEYNVRRQQCEKAVEWLQETYPEVHSLRDASLAMLGETVKPKDPLIYQRARFIVEENNRVLRACDHLRDGDLAALGSEMYRSHYGLSREYEVSCKELDVLVELAKPNSSVLGARMMGGGFGGCTINLVKEEAIGGLISQIKEPYESRTGLPLTYYIVSIGDGTEILQS